MAGQPVRVLGTVLNEQPAYTLGELCWASGLSAEELVELVTVGIIEPVETHQGHWQFSGRAVVRLQTALRLQRELGINREGAALVVDLLGELQELRNRVQFLERQLFE